MKNGFTKSGDSGVAAYDPIPSLFARLGATGTAIDPFARNTLYSDDAATALALQGDTIAVYKSISGSPVAVKLAQTVTTRRPALSSPYGPVFNGADDYLAFPDDANLRFGTTSFTIAASFKVFALGINHTIFAKRGNGASGTLPGWGLRVNAANSIAFVYDYTGNVDSIAKSVSASNSIAQDVWIDAMIQFDYAVGAGAALATGFIDNVAQAQTKTYTAGDISSGATTPLVIGGDSTGLFANAIIGRCLAINKSLSTEDRTIVNNWLKAGHP